MRADDDRIEPYPENVVAYPGTVKAAGIVWIIFGNLILLNMLLFVLLMAALAPGNQAVMAGGMCGGLLLGVFGAAFIYVGVQSVRGTAADTLGNGIGSIVFGLFNLASGVVQAGGGGVVQAGIGLLAGAGLIAAGVLALVGRDQYKAWRRATVAQRPARPGR